MTHDVNVPDGATRMHDAIIRLPLCLLADSPVDQFAKAGLVIRMNPLKEFFESGKAILGIETQNTVAFLRPVPDILVWIPRPTPRLTEPLTFCKKRLTGAQVLLRVLAYDPLGNRVGSRCERVENGFRKWATREQRHHSDQAILDHQRVSGEGNHSVIPCPTPVMHAWIVHNVIGEMRLFLAGNQSDLQVSNGNSAVFPIQTRVHPRARMQLQYAFILVQHPDSGEGRVEVTNDSLRASTQNLCQMGRLGKGSAHVSPNARLARLRVLRPLSAVNVGRSHIPALDFSLRIEQRVVADQEPPIFPIFPEHSLLIFERDGACESLSALFAQSFHILRVEDTSAIVLFPRIFQSKPREIQDRLIRIQHGPIGAQHVNTSGDPVDSQAQIFLARTQGFLCLLAIVDISKE